MGGFLIRGEVQFVEIGWDQIGWDLDCTWFWKAPTCSLRAVFLYERPSREVQEQSPAAKYARPGPVDLWAGFPIQV